MQNEFDLEVVVPNTNERDYLQDLIYNELVKGAFSTAAKEQCIRIIQKLQEQGIEGVILGCTELPILIPDSAISLPTFDTTMIHSKAAVDFALN